MELVNTVATLAQITLACALTAKPHRIQHHFFFLRIDSSSGVPTAEVRLQLRVQVRHLPSEHQLRSIIRARRYELDEA
jgi:hypothetical protein